VKVAFGSVLLLIDLQRAVDDPSWGVRNNPDAEKNVARLLTQWRTLRWPVVHVRHDSVEPNSTYRPNQPLHAFKPEATPLQSEPVIAKQTNGAFFHTGLDQWLRDGDHHHLVVAGAITNNSVETTVRMAGNLGFATTLVGDACFTFAKTDWNGIERSADAVHAMSLANLDGEYCTVVTTADVLAGLGS
jgi:nicotinamidase-related amidase